MYRSIALCFYVPSLNSQKEGKTSIAQVEQLAVILGPLQLVLFRENLVLLGKKLFGCVCVQDHMEQQGIRKLDSS